MFKKLFVTILAVAMMAFMVAPAPAAMQDFMAYVYSWDGKMGADGKMALTRVTSGITFTVLTIDSDTIATLYEPSDQDSGLTALVNPVTTTSFNSATICNDRVAFRTDTTTYVDVIVTNTAGGYTAFVENMDKYTHTIVIDQRPNIMHHGIIPWKFLVAGTEVDTGIDFAYDTAIFDVLVETVTVDTGETVDVGTLSSGTAGDANGFRTLVSVATAGYPTDTAIITGGTTIDYVPVTTYGALLVTAITGSDAVATVGGKSYIGPYIITGANEQSLTYTPSAGDTGVGYIHYFFMRLR